MLIAIGNSNDRALAPEAQRLLDDPSPLVRGAAVWALSQLMEQAEFEVLAAEAIHSESDETVRAEWQNNSTVMPRESGRESGASSVPR